MYDDIKESKAFRKFLKGKISFEESSEKVYLSKMATYCYFHQEFVDDIVKRYKKNQKELDEDEDEEDLEVFGDLTDFGKHCVKNKQAKSTIRDKIKRVRIFLIKNGVKVPKIDDSLKNYDDSEGYYTKKDLPDKESMKTIINGAKHRYKAIFSFVYTTGSGRSETANVTIKSFLEGISEFCETTEPRAMIKELDGHTAEKEVIPLIKMTRKKTGKPYYTVTTPEVVQFIIDYFKTDLSVLDNVDGKLFGVVPGTISEAFKSTNIKYGFGKRGRYNFFGCHRLRHNHYTQIDNPNLANALEGRVVRDEIGQRYDHNLDDPEYLREKYKDHMHKFEIFDHYDITIRDEEVRRLQEENEELRKQIAKTQEAVEDLGYKIESNRTNIPYHKVHNAITSYLKSIDVMDNNRASLLNLMVLDYVKSNPNEFKDDEEYLLDLVKKLDIKIELSSKDIIQQHIELAQNMDYDDIDPAFIMFLDELVGIIQKNEAVMKRVGFINVDKFDYVAESYLVNSKIIPDISKVDLSQFTQDDKERIAGEILIRYIDTD